LAAAFLGSVCQEALQLGLLEREIAFCREVHIPVFYKNAWVSAEFRADFVCFDSVVVELKTTQKLTGTEEAQVINYLRATRHEVGLSLNFGAKSLEYCRFIFSRSVSSAD
jgi:GxxExxY protein